jgi:hypothetical protein
MKLPIRKRKQKNLQLNKRRKLKRRLDNLPFKRNKKKMTVEKL